jgi:hypothetical protein
MRENPQTPLVGKNKFFSLRVGVLIKNIGVIFKF